MHCTCFDLRNTCKQRPRTQLGKQHFITQTSSGYHQSLKDQSITLFWGECLLLSTHTTVDAVPTVTVRRHTNTEGVIRCWATAFKLVSLYTWLTHAQTPTVSNISTLIFLWRRNLSKWNRKQRQRLCALSCPSFTCDLLW